MGNTVQWEIPSISVQITRLHSSAMCPGALYKQITNRFQDYHSGQDIREPALPSHFSEDTHPKPNTYTCIHTV